MTELKPVFWFGETKRDLSCLAEDVKDMVGQALFEAKMGGRHASVKALRGYGDAGVLEVVANYAGDTFRAVYTVRWPGRIYVLHVFQKKSRSGVRTPKPEMELIDARLKHLAELQRLEMGPKK